MEAERVEEREEGIDGECDARARIGHIGGLSGEIRIYLSES
jgi:hypothetical protein